MSRFKKLSHVIWFCQYHIVFVPKYRYRIKCSARSCPFACKSPTQDFIIRISWKNERKDSDSSFPEIPEFTDKEILREPFLVCWVLC